MRWLFAAFPILVLAGMGYSAQAGIHYLNRSDSTVNSDIKTLVANIESDPSLTYGVQTALKFLNEHPEASFRPTDLVAIGQALEKKQAAYEASKEGSRARDPIEFKEQYYHFNFQAKRIIPPLVTVLDYWDYVFKHKLIEFSQAQGSLIEHALKTEKMAELLKTFFLFSAHGAQMPIKSLNQIMDRLIDHMQKIPDVGYMPLIKSTVDNRFMSYDAYITFFLLNQGVSPNDRKLAEIADALFDKNESSRDPIYIVGALILNPTMVDERSLRYLGETIMVIKDPPASAMSIEVRRFNFYYDFFERWAEMVAKLHPIRQQALLQAFENVLAKPEQAANVIHFFSRDNHTGRMVDERRAREVEGLRLLYASLQRHIAIASVQTKQTPPKAPPSEPFKLLHFPGTCENKLVGN